MNREKIREGLYLVFQSMKDRVRRLAAAAAHDEGRIDAGMVPAELLDAPTPEFSAGARTRLALRAGLVQTGTVNTQLLNRLVGAGVLNQYCAKEEADGKEKAGPYKFGFALMK